MRVPKTTCILSATAAIALLFTGCGESKVAQCNKIVQVANKAVTLGQEFGKNPRPEKGSKSLTEGSEKIDKIASELKTLEIKDEKLQEFKERFIKLYDDTSKGLKDTASAVDKKDIKAANISVQNLKKSASDESGLVKEINAYCTGK